MKVILTEKETIQIGFGADGDPMFTVSGKELFDALRKPFIEPPEALPLCPFCGNPMKAMPQNGKPVVSFECGDADHHASFDRMDGETVEEFFERVKKTGREIQMMDEEEKKRNRLRQVYLEWRAAMMAIVECLFFKSCSSDDKTILFKRLASANQEALQLEKELREAKND